MKYLICLIGLICYSHVNSQILSPQEFMPHLYGEEFTPHHRLVDYFYSVAKSSDIVQVQEYGKTNQKRPLIYAIVTHPDNHNNIDAIRLNNLRHAQLVEGQVDEKLNKSIVWLSFGVHGNEAGASESSMMTLYALATGTVGAENDWLKNTIVIIDPCVNPDGYNRYTHWNINHNGNFKNPHRADNEHVEPWPSGRVNHFYHDLNRDWAWASQIETQQRLIIYHNWLPHIHSDFHEMFPESPYYFAPAAEPFHRYISDWQRDFQMDVGRNHARHFDKNNWLYYTREQFDLFYPSYGDTYPIFNGAIGMTYEQAGHGISGRSILLDNGDTLKLQDRIDHHLTTALSTVEVASREQKRITAEFNSYFDNSINSPKGSYQNYIIKQNESNDLSEFLSLLDRHQIRYEQSKTDGKIDGFCFPDFSERSFTYQEGDVVVSANQPHGVMVQVLLEPKSKLQDSLTYDITAWSLLAAYGFEAVATSKSIATAPYKTPANNSSELTNAYAYAIPYRGWGTACKTAKLIQSGVQCRLAAKPLTNSGHSFNQGTIIITQADNKNKNLLTTFDACELDGSNIKLLHSGFSDQGPDIGSDEIRLISSTKILLVGGEGVNQYNYGQIWQLLDSELQIGYTTTLEKNFSQHSLADFTTIILPEGHYPSFNEATITKLKSWVAAGGKLICFNSALTKIANEKGFNIQLKKEEKEEDKKKEESEKGDHKLERFESALRSSISNWMPGAIVRLNLDNSHPLGFGLSDYYPSLKLSTMTIPHQKNTWNVGFIKDDLQHTGFIGNEVKEKLLNTSTFIVKDLGQGHVIGFIDNPLYRSFWQNGKKIFYNALFMVQ